jgi:peroxiredoxin Q/BCP
MLQNNIPAPDFTLPDQDSVEHTLSSYQGSFVLVYFYPKDDTPGCTKEACAIRDAYDIFKQHGITVLGISKDSVASHKKFAEKYGLPFTLLADTDKKVISDYRAGSFLMTKRISYLIDPQGMIAKSYPKVDPAMHAKEILDDVQMLQKGE